YLGIRSLRRIHADGDAAERQPAARRVLDPVAATSESNRADRGRSAGPRGSPAKGPRDRHARRHPDPGYQALSVGCAGREVAPRVAGGSRSAEPSPSGWPTALITGTRTEFILHVPEEQYRLAGLLRRRHHRTFP